MAQKKWINCVAEIRATKGGDGRYIRINKPFTVYKGSSFKIENYAEYLNNLLDKEIITQEEYENRIKVSSDHGGFVYSVLHMPPSEPKTDEDKALEKSGKGVWINNAVDVRKGKEGNLYLFANKSFSATEKNVIQLTKLKDHINSLVDKGLTTKEKAADQLKKLGDGDPKTQWLLYKGTVTPDKE